VDADGFMGWAVAEQEQQSLRVVFIEDEFYFPELNEGSEFSSEFVFSVLFEFAVSVHEEGDEPCKESAVVLGSGVEEDVGDEVEILHEILSLCQFLLNF
jgi:hypothetical protein